MFVCEFCLVMQYDIDVVYVLICELKQVEFDYYVFCVGFNVNLCDLNMCYYLVLLDGEVVGMIGLYLQFYLYYVNWIGEIQELVVMLQVCGLNVGSKLLVWVEEEVCQVGVEMIEFFINVKCYDVYCFYLCEGYEQSYFCFIKVL